MALERRLLACVPLFYELIFCKPYLIKKKKKNRTTCVQDASHPSDSFQVPTTLPNNQSLSDQWMFPRYMSVSKICVSLYLFWLSR